MKAEYKITRAAIRLLNFNILLRTKNSKDQLLSNEAKQRNWQKKLNCFK
jgi:hypothetical protein